MARFSEFHAWDGAVFRRAATPTSSFDTLHVWHDGQWRPLKSAHVWHNGAWRAVYENMIAAPTTPPTISSFTASGGTLTVTVASNPENARLGYVFSQKFGGTLVTIESGETGNGGTSASATTPMSSGDVFHVEAYFINDAGQTSSTTAEVTV